ncbi:MULTISPECIES: cysteine hydrolase family protein [unclassified Brenneria]|uniref:cysteine hydrolase family protein n=1 Tax=unclassified Brenneria TaxID=2634434 RepID=UPI0018F0F4BE|nr:isochorismatase family cysteine hydrolase [Brenneria sp. L3-3C-1]MBJ7220784.1 cysteine hydrolase [Brenneria sp. L3-3C-1]MEE3642024.1 isochorismatase family cysteine hydrolase [Brenneria sp. L3_3C_1]
MSTENFPAIKKTALIIVDMQNDFIRDGAPLEVPGGRDIIGRNLALLHYFRERGEPVIFLRWLAVENDPHHRLGGKFSWMSLLDENTKSCRLGFKRRYRDTETELDCSAVIDELKPRDNEFTVFKYGYGGFYGTSLGELLALLGVDTLVVTGVVAECCVEDTVRQAWNHAYAVLAVSDAIAAMNEKRMAESMSVIEENYGWVAETSDVISLLNQYNNK